MLLLGSCLRARSGASADPVSEPADESAGGGGRSLQARCLSGALRLTVRPLIGAWTVVPWLPWPYQLADLAGLLGRPVRGTRFSAVEIGGVRVQEVLPDRVAVGRTVLYFHGGAFLVGGWLLHRSLLSRIAAATSARVLAVDYRHLPAHPVSAAVADCAAVYAALAAEADAAELVVMGDSAGGFLSFTTLAGALAAGLPMPAAVVALSPLCEVRPELGSDPTTGCALFGPRTIAAMLRFASAREHTPGHHHPSDALADGLPPILIEVARHESLYPQVERFAEELRAAGAEVDLHSWDLDVHVFQAAAGWVPEAKDALAYLAQFCESAWGTAQRRRR